MHTKYCWESLEGRDHLRGVDVNMEDGSIKDHKEMGFDDVDWIYLGQDSVHMADCFESDKEPLGYIKREEFLYHLSDCQLLKKGSAAWMSTVKPNYP
jgi:hypothetical protein